MSAKFAPRSVSKKRIKDYYLVDDYYFRASGSKVELYGDGAQILGLKGKNISPESLGALVCDRKTAAKDLTCCAPKTVSIAALMGDEKLRTVALEAHRLGVQEIIDDMQSSGCFQVRRRRGQVTESVAAEGLVVASVGHFLSRENDPHLHSHLLVMNAGLIPGESISRSVDYQPMFVRQHHFDAIYKARMARHFVENGIPVRQTKDGFELAHISDKQLREFSARGKQVEANLAAQGLTRASATGAQKDVAALKGRRVKDEGMTPAMMQRMWAAKAAAVGLEVNAVQAMADVTADPSERRERIDALVADTIGNQGIFTRRGLVDHVLKEVAIDGLYASRGEVETALRRYATDNPLVELPGQATIPEDRRRQTTVALLEAERDNERLARSGAIRNQLAPHNYDVAQRLDATAKRVFDFRFGGEQRDAALGILATRDRITLVQGDPGTGKTTLMRAVIETHGRSKFVGLAKAGAAAKKLGDETGILGQTIDRFLIDYDRRQRALDPASSMRPRAREAALEDTAYIPRAFGEGDGYLIVDEGSMVGSIEANRLAKIAEAEGARLVIPSGDRQQLPGVGAGKPFEIWQDLGVTTHHLTEIRRQRDSDELAAVKAITARDSAAEAVAILRQATDQRTGRPKDILQEIVRPRERLETITAEYLAEVDAGQPAPLLITGRNTEKDTLNRQIRWGLQERGLVARDGHKIEAEDNRSRARELQFAKGDRIIFESNDNRNRVEMSAAGNPILNGNRGRIEGIELEAGRVSRLHVELEDGRMARFDPREYKRFNHAYAISSYKSQGQSVDELVMYHAPSTSPLLSKNEFLVGISRQKNRLRIYTDSAEGMTARAEAWVQKETALGQWRDTVARTNGHALATALITVEARRQERDTLLEQKRGLLMQAYAAEKWQEVPPKERQVYNEYRNRSRDIYHRDVRGVVQSQQIDATDETAQRLRKTVTAWDAEQGRLHAELDKLTGGKRRVAGHEFANNYRAMDKADDKLSIALDPYRVERVQQIEREAIRDQVAAPVQQVQTQPPVDIRNIEERIRSVFEQYEAERQVQEQAKAKEQAARQEQPQTVANQVREELAKPKPPHAQKDDERRRLEEEEEEERRRKPGM